MRYAFLFVLILASCTNNYNLGNDFSLQQDEISDSYTIYYKSEGFLNDDIKFYAIDNRIILLKDINGNIITINKDRFIKGYGTLKSEKESISRFKNENEFKKCLNKKTIDWISVVRSPTSIRL